MPASIPLVRPSERQSARPRSRARIDVGQVVRSVPSHRRQNTTAGREGRHRAPSKGHRTIRAIAVCIPALALLGGFVAYQAQARLSRPGSGGPAAYHLRIPAPDDDVANGIGRAAVAAGKPRRAVTAAPADRATPTATPSPSPVPDYLNPLRAIHNLVPERVDMGVDFGGSGPVYAIGDAVVTGATGDSAGWPGGGWITYRLTAGPGTGLQVFVAEDVKPAVQVGEHVTSGSVIAEMFDGGAGIETGWAMADGSSAESQLPEAGGISGRGPFPTKIGLNFDGLLIALGVPAGFGYTQAGGYGTVPSQYPDWSTVL